MKIVNSLQKNCYILNKQSGITLIALVITIIIMLILIGVSINISLNGGLFDKAKTAAMETEKHSIYEQIVQSMQLNSNNMIDIARTYSSAKSILELQDKTVSEITDGIFDVTGNYGTYTYTITEEKILIGEHIIYAEPCINDFELEISYDSVEGILTISPTTSNIPDINFLDFEATQRILKFGGVEKTEGVTWNNNTASYTVTQDELSQIGTIQLELIDIDNNKYVGEGIYIQGS